MNMMSARSCQVHRSVLIIDDNEDLARSLSCLLEFHGFHVDVALDGPEGVRLALHNHFDVVIVDIGLPSMSGYEVATAIRAGAVEPPLLLAQTAYGQPDDVRRSFDAGFDGHLVKPVLPSEIVRHVVEGRPAAAQYEEDSESRRTSTGFSTRDGYSFETAHPTRQDARTVWRRDVPKE
jgi:CheY-like chemotaxis protein